MSREKVGGFERGSKHSEAAKSLVSQSLIGKIGPQARRWKGDAAGYVAKHLWLVKHFGKADRCENQKCTFKFPRRYEWANLTGDYKRLRSDWIRLCPSCHRLYDYGKLEISR